MKKTVEERFWEKVTKTDTCWLWTGSMKSNGYGSFQFHNGVEYVHRVSWQLANGKQIPKGMLIDHTCFVHNCVNPEHLRLVTQKQNQENRASQRSDNTSGYRGVTWQKNRWIANVWHQGEIYCAGRFRNIEDANAAATALRNELFTHNDLDRRSKKAA